MIKVGAYPTKSIQLTLSWSGCWEALVTFEGKGLSGPVVIDWRGWKLTGAVDVPRTGLFAGEPATIIIGGLGWCTRREWRPYQSDRGLTAREVALSVAEQVGQTIEVSQDRTLGKYFVPRRESGGQILSRLFGKHWHVGVDGTTRAQVRGTPTIRKSVAVLNYDPRDGRAEVYADRPDQTPLGAILPKDARLTANRRITKVIVTASGNKERIVCYTEDGNIITNPAPLGPIITFTPVVLES
jgi:hypothetical protein